MTRYLISRIGDPAFALFIGASAAILRIRREEAEKNRGSQETFEVLKRRVSWYFGR